MLLNAHLLDACLVNSWRAGELYAPGDTDLLTVQKAVATILLLPTLLVSNDRSAVLSWFTVSVTVCFSDQSQRKAQCLDTKAK